MPKIFSLFLVLFLFFNCSYSLAQKDSTRSDVAKRNRVFAKQDASKIWTPKVYTIRSAILPGWGQASLKKYWKVPLVYAALGITAGVFFHNIRQYKEAKNSYINATDSDTSNDYLIPEPYYSVRSQPDAIRNFRNEVRQNIDYSVLFFIVFWGLNVVDATVDAHLKTFDVGDNLSFQLKPGFSPMANTNGISLIMNIHPKIFRERK